MLGTAGLISQSLHASSSGHWKTDFTIIWIHTFLAYISDKLVAENFHIKTFKRSRTV